MSTPDSVVEVTGLTKRFSGQTVLDGIDLDLRPGEIHALLGENGAGKSTLIKILAGVIGRDAGAIRIAGHDLPARHDGHAAQAAGLAFVHQDLGLIDELSVAENIALATGYGRRFGMISMSRTRAAAAVLLRGLELDIPAGSPVGTLTQDEKVMVAVARAFSLNARAIVLDEVSSSLPGPEVDRLLASLRRLKRSGVAFLYVTHRLGEIFGLADRLTVLRDGRRVATALVADVDHDRVVSWIIGKAAHAASVPRVSRTAPDAVRVAVDGLHGGSLAAPVSLAIAPGEIVGVCGLVGSGARDVAGLVAGAISARGGTMQLDGTILPLGDVHRLRRSGCLYVPGDRQAAGAVDGMSVRENLFLARLHRGDDDGWYRRPSTERRAAGRLAQRFRVHPPAVDGPLLALSGGNQQKVVLARALRAQPALLVLDDPTAGVDVGSRGEVHALIRASAAAGSAVLLASTDFDEVAALADRVLVMRGGRLAAELRGTDITASRLAVASYENTEHSILTEEMPS